MTVIYYYPFHLSFLLSFLNLTSFYLLTVGVDS